jgi:hypothetical protein
MLAQLHRDRVGHDLAAIDLRRLAPVDHGVPARIRVAVNGHLEIAGADRSFTISSSSAPVFVCLSTRPLMTTA